MTTTPGTTPGTTPDTPAIPEEDEDLYGRVHAAIIVNLMRGADGGRITDSAMRIFANYIRAQVAHFDRLADGSPQGTGAGRAMGLAYRAAAGHLRHRADEIDGGNPE